MNMKMPFNRRNRSYTTKDTNRTIKHTVRKGKKIIGWTVGIAVLTIIGLNSFYQIKEQEQAVLVTLGKAKAVTFYSASAKSQYNN